MNSLKIFLKRVVLLSLIILVSPLILAARLGFMLGTENLYHSLACLLSLVPGKTGSYLRLGYYKGTLKKISSDVIIGFGSFFSRPAAEVGRGVTVGAYCILGRVALGDGVLIASRVSIPSGKYQHGGSEGTAGPGEVLRFDKVTIGARTWIGEGAVVLSDIGEDCIVSAGSVVTRAIPGGYIIAGNPAKPTLKRNLEGSGHD